MNPNSCRTQPAVRPDEIEWVFVDGQPAIVVHYPTEDRSWMASDVLRADLSHMSPLSRESVRAWLLLALSRVDESRGMANKAGA